MQNESRIEMEVPKCFHSTISIIINFSRSIFLYLKRLFKDPWGPGGVSREFALPIPMSVIEGDWNRAVSRNNL